MGDKPARRMLDHAIDGGVGNQGISVPIRGPCGEFALFSLSHSCRDAVWAKGIGNRKSMWGCGSSPIAPLRG